MKYLVGIGGRRAAALRLATLLAIALAAVAAAAGVCLEKTPLGLLVSSRGGCSYTRIVLAVPPGLGVEVQARGPLVVEARPLGWEARVLHTVDGVYVVPVGPGSRLAAKFAPELFNVEAVARVFLNGRPLVLEARVEGCSGPSLHMTRTALLAAGAEVEALKLGGGRHSWLLRITVDNPARLGKVYAVLADARCVVSVGPASPLGGAEPAAGRLPAGLLPDAPPTPYAVALRDRERSAIGAWNGTG